MGHYAAGLPTVKEDFFEIHFLLLFGNAMLPDETKLIMHPSEEGHVRPILIIT